MKFDELDERMRHYESQDPVLPGDTFLVARIDGRGFTRLTKEILDLERPFDHRFHDHMLATVLHLMNAGFRALYGYTQSDEISLLFGRDERSFGRSVRKWTSLLAGEASAAFSVRIGCPAAFDCRVVTLSSPEVVVDYFRWRAEDANRNALNAWCYWQLRGDGWDAQRVTAHLDCMPVREKAALLASRGVAINSLPNWQRRGSGLIWEEFEKEAVNPSTGAAVIAMRRRLRVVRDLPTRDDYTAFIQRLLV